MLIGVLNSRFETGVNRIDDLAGAEAMHMRSLPEALEEEWESDAHFTIYQIPGESHWPRLLKPTLNQIREHGLDILVSVMVVDWDTPDHVPWTQELFEHFEAVFTEAAQKFPLINDWRWFYTTRCGVRLIYELDKSIPADIYENYMRWFSREMRKAGLDVDELADWTRLFRLPKVLRMGPKGATKTCEEEFFLFFENDENPVLRSADMGQVKRHENTMALAVTPEDYQGGKPSDAESFGYLVTLAKNGKQEQTEWYKEAKKRLKGRECYSCIFEGALIAKKGNRDQRIASFAGQAVSLLMRNSSATPEKIYALFFDTVSKLDPDDQTPDWTDVLWDKICRFWEQEDAKRETETMRQEEAVKKAQSVAERMVEGITGWSDADVLCGDDEIAKLEYLNRRMIASCGKSFWVMNKDGEFPHRPVSATQLIPYIRSEGMDRVIDTVEFIKGEQGDRSVKSIINEHATVVHSIEAQPCLRGGFIRDIDTDQATLVVPSFDRNRNLEPTFNADVDAWLRHMFGQHYEDVCRWIAWALAFEEGPICGLSIEADPSVGKKLFTVGLSECLRSPCLASGEDLVDQFQSGLLRSPFISINEGWPSARKNYHNPADMFRKLTGGDPIWVNEKFQQPIYMRYAARVVLTANNEDTVNQLFGDTTLSNSDRAALHLRLMHMQLGDDGAVFLRERGGLSYTNGWIRGDGNQPSQYIVAKHFLWLYSHRHDYPKDDRLLVQGNSNDDVLFHMRTGVGHSSVVVETLIKFIEFASKNRGKAVGIHIDRRHSKIFVLTSNIISFYRQEMSGPNRQLLTVENCNKALQGLTLTVSKAQVLKNARPSTRRRWHELDIDILQKVSQRDGWECNVLDTLIAKREGYLDEDPAKKVIDEK